MYGENNTSEKCEGKQILDALLSGSVKDSLKPKGSAEGARRLSALFAYPSVCNREKI